MLKNKVIDLIQNEDKKRTLTDKEIAEILKTNRENITQIRLELRIPNSSERRKQFIKEDIKKILENDINITDRKLSSKLKELGYDISRYSAVQLKKQILFNQSHISNKIKNKNLGDAMANNVLKNKNKKMDDINKKNMDDKVNKNVAENVIQNKNVKEKHNISKKVDKYNDFNEIVGFNKSLKMQVSQAKAAILYPPHGLHTLLLGPSGVGKSYFARAMHDFSVSCDNFKENAPFIVFNCADYANNPQLLLSQLFGYTKGAFTGANIDKKGLVEKANGGILFLDEVHRLPNEGQEILFHLLDSGMYRRLGEVENTRKVEVMIIAATTEDPNTSLLLTFTRRIPMVIELPSLQDRPLKERYELIKRFFSQESFRVGKTIVVDYEAIKLLMKYKCSGNIGQLRSDVQVSCARGLLNSKTMNSDKIYIEVDELPLHIKKEALDIQKRDPYIENFFKRDLIVNPETSNIGFMESDRYVLPGNIYEFIDEKFNQLEKQGIDNFEINKIVSNKVEFKLTEYAKNIEMNTNEVNKNLETIVGTKIINVVNKVKEIGRNFFDNIQDSFYYCVAIHLSNFMERLKVNHLIKNPQLSYIKSEYDFEYKIAKLMANEINRGLCIELPEDEIGFIAMYLKTFTDTKQYEETRVAVIALTHGRVATAMTDVANKLLDVNHAVGVEMSLTESPREALTRTMEVVKKVDEGKGCLILVDMGSLITFGEIITKKTGIPTRVIGRVDTVMVLEAVRRAIIPESNLYEIADALDDKKNYVAKVEEIKEISKFPKAIVTLCITGDGTALKIKQYIQDLIKKLDKNIKVIPMGFIKQKDIHKAIIKLKKENNIIAIVGTIDPKFNSIPFISFEEILTGIGIKEIEKLLGIKTINPLKNIINEELIIKDRDIEDKNEAIGILFDLLFKKGYVNDKFILSVYKREVIGSTAIVNKIAIPHGNSKDVLKSGVAVLILNEPINWDFNKKVKYIFMLAIKQIDNEAFTQLYNIFNNKERLRKIENTTSNAEIKQIITEI